MRSLSLLFLLCAGIMTQALAGADSITIHNSGVNSSIRGMSMAGNSVVWLSGSNGHVARSTDGGKSWKWMVVEGFEKMDFRDIHAFDSSVAVVMSVGNPAYVLKTRDGGQSWKTVFTKEAPGMFLDAMDFKNDREGICIGDPVEATDGKRGFFIMRTKDGGDSWIEESVRRLPQPQDGEAVFSASGTNIAFLNDPDFDYAFISGGAASNLYLLGRREKPGKIFRLRMNKGTGTTGAFSLATDRKSRFYCIGGDYKAPDLTSGNFIWTTDKGKTWRSQNVAPPSGYRSCIRIVDGDRLVACGPNGVDIASSPDSWKRISGEGFNVCMVTPNRRLILFAGEKGKIGLLKL